MIPNREKTTILSRHCHGETPMIIQEINKVWAQRNITRLSIAPGGVQRLIVYKEKVDKREVIDL